MGQQSSSDMQPVNYTLYADVLLSSDHWENFGIDCSLQRFSGLNSTEELYAYRDQVLYTDELTAAGSTVDRVGQALSGFSVVPNAVGLGALVISLILEAVGKSLNKNTLGTAEMMDRMFAQEKVREVRDLMEEYLKRLQINLGNQQLQLDSTRQIESDLSAQLTRLKNSMLKDGHLNARSLKQWLNGAAFHTQVLIHDARLRGANPTRAIQAAGLYQQQTNVLLTRYKEHVLDVLRIRSDSPPCFRYCPRRYEWHCQVIFPDSQSHSRYPQVYEFEHDCVIHVHEKEVVEAIFADPRVSWTNQYFENLRADVPTLVRQNGPFHIKNQHNSVQH